jgi:hypothetical protein
VWIAEVGGYNGSNKDGLEKFRKSSRKFKKSGRDHTKVAKSDEMRQKRNDRDEKYGHEL